MLCRKLHVEAMHGRSGSLIRKDVVRSVYPKDNHGGQWGMERRGEKVFSRGLSSWDLLRVLK